MATATGSGGSYALECCLERDGIRAFKSMLVCLDRFGKDLFLEANGTEVTLRTLNAAQSAFVIFTLQSGLFSMYRMDRAEPASVKLHLKNVTSIFRSITNVERVWLQVATGDPGDAAPGPDGEAEEPPAADAYMRVQLLCTSGLRKKFDLAFQEVTSMKAIYDKSACPHVICAEPGLMLECLKNFPSSLNEVTLVAADDALLLKNLVDHNAAMNEQDAADGGGIDAVASLHLRTEMRLKPSDLHEYALGVPRPPSGVCVSFSQREFKAVLTLVKELDHRIACHIEGGGRPIIFSSRDKGEHVAPFKVECVLATVVETTPMGDDDDDFFGEAGYAPPSSAAPPYQHQYQYQQPQGQYASSFCGGGSAPYTAPRHHQQPPGHPPPGASSQPTPYQHPPYPPPAQYSQYSHHAPPGQHHSQPPGSGAPGWGYPPTAYQQPPPHHGHSQPAPPPSAYHQPHSQPPPHGQWTPQPHHQHHTNAPGYSSQPPPQHSGAPSALSAAPSFYAQSGGAPYYHDANGSAGGAAAWPSGATCIPPTPQHAPPSASCSHNGPHTSMPCGGAPPSAQAAYYPPPAAAPAYEAMADPPAVCRPDGAGGGGGDGAESDDTEEDEEGVPGTPPDPEWPEDSNKRPRTDGGDFGW